MPLVQVTLLKGRTIEQKRKVAERITQVMVEEAKATKEAGMTSFDHRLPDSVSQGELMALVKKLKIGRAHV